MTKSAAIDVLAIRRGGSWPPAYAEVAVSRNALGVSEACWCYPLARPWLGWLRDEDPDTDWMRWRDPTTGHTGFLCKHCQRPVIENRPPRSLEDGQ